ncbi:WecB/TagA/CpsF family glycosyltransferase [Escherichia coli]|nr:WecB/TagA/CpsF family glycosyltransferase [Escherichia coli]
MSIAGRIDIAEPPRIRNIMGVDVSALTQREAVDLVAERIAARQFTKVAFLNAHVANIAQSDAGFCGILRDFLVVPDGVGVDIASKALFGAKFPANLNGTDFVPHLLIALPRKIRVGLLGAERDSVEAAADRLKRIAPAHDYVIYGDGFFTREMEPAILNRLQNDRPDLLLVAMGVPRQEYWIDGISGAHASVAMAVGALFDFLSGAVPRAPLWMRKARLEWLFRLIIEPSRLWRRYLVGNPLFIFRLLRQLVAGQRSHGA